MTCLVSGSCACYQRSSGLFCSVIQWRPSISWASWGWIKCPIQCHISSTINTSHPIINIFIPLLDSGLDLYLCPSCQTTSKQTEASSLGQVSYLCSKGQLQCPGSYLKPQSVSFIYLTGCVILSLWQGFPYLLGCTWSLFPHPQMKQIDWVISKNPLQLIACYHLSILQEKWPYHRSMAWGQRTLAFGQSLRSQENVMGMCLQTVHVQWPMTLEMSQFGRK